VFQEIEPLSLGIVSRVISDRIGSQSIGNTMQMMIVVQ
jgi:hypothetical protein